MILKSPCIIDVSHWETVDWTALDARVVGVFMKASQGKYYFDPTFKTNWNGATGLPKSAYHFFEINDISSQVANFLETCEEVGAIVSGKWMGEIEPVLDAEYQPPTTADRLTRAIGLGSVSKPRIRATALADLMEPEKYLARRIPMGIRAAGVADYKSATSSITTGISGAELANQYKVWLDLVEGELGVRPIIYTSKWMWIHTGFPAWAKDYKLWDAQYPYNPDGQTDPLYVPYGGWQDWWLWQYSSAGSLAGISGAVDLNVFNGSAADWDYFYGGGYGQIPEPPNGGSMQVTPKDMIGSKIRSGAGLTFAQVGSLGYGSKLDVIALTGTAGSEQWAQVVWAGNKAFVAVWYGGIQTAILSGTLPGPVEPVKTHDIDVFSDGTISVDGGARQ